MDTAGLTSVFVTSGTVAIAAAMIAATARHGIGTRAGQPASGGDRAASPRQNVCSVWHR